MSIQRIHNAWLYNLYLPVHFALFAVFAQRIRSSAGALGLCIAALAIYGSLLWFESREPSCTTVLFSRSLLFAWAYLSVMFTWQLLVLAERTDQPLWKDQQFWLYLSIVTFFGVSLPFIGSMNKVYASDPDLAGGLYYILDVLYFLSYAMAGIAGWMIGRPKSNVS